MNKAYQFRLYPNKEQKILFAKTFGSVRFIYNKMLEAKITHYKKTGENLKTTPAGYKGEFVWLKEVDSLALTNAQLNLQAAYKNFFRDKNIGFPKYKSKHRDKDSYTTNLVNGNIALSQKYLKLPKVGFVRVKTHRDIPRGHKLKSVTVSRTAAGEYHASVLYEYHEETPSVKPEKVLGLDFSMSVLYVDSNGKSAGYPKYYRKAQNALAREQRKLSRRRKGGTNREKQRIKVAKTHGKVKNQRKDFLHKQSRQIANGYDAVAVEDLNMKGMQQALNFGKSVSDNGWGMFTAMLQYKLEERGKQLVRVGKFFPSSKKCSNCGEVKEELPLAERVYHCDICGFSLDRDENAAINIRKEGLRLLTA